MLNPPPSARRERFPVANEIPDRWRPLPFPSPRFSSSPTAGVPNPMPSPSSIARSLPRCRDRPTARIDIGEAELAVMLTDDAGIRTLNSNWRGIDKPTNVLSFPALQPTGGSGPDDAPRMLGDIAIAYETTRRRPTTSKSRSIIISAIWRSTASCIWWATITRPTTTPKPWKASSRRFWRNSAFPIRTRIEIPMANRDRSD